MLEREPAGSVCLKADTTPGASQRTPDDGGRRPARLPPDPVQIHGEHHTQHGGRDVDERSEPHDARQQAVQRQPDDGSDIPSRRDLSGTISAISRWRPEFVSRPTSSAKGTRLQPTRSSSASNPSDPRLYHTASVNGATSSRAPPMSSQSLPFPVAGELVDIEIVVPDERRQRRGPPRESRRSIHAVRAASAADSVRRTSGRNFITVATAISRAT